jgi:hypothetical protein
MFDGSLPEIGELAALDDSALVDAAAGWARTENAACARKTAVMAELFARRTGLPAGERERWWVDPQAAVGAELGATQHISAWMALAQAHRGVVLADRLPKVAALFAAGVISEVLVRAIEYRTALVTDAAAIARLDELLAEQVSGWGPLSARKLEQVIDAIVDRVDPGALRRSRKASCGRDVQFGSPSDEAGFTSMWARLYAPDAVVVQQRVEEMARSVCEDDPRTLGERRSEALAAIAAGSTELACQCGGTECPAAGREASPPATAVIHVIAHADTVDAARAENGATTPPPEACGPTDDDRAPAAPEDAVPTTESDDDPSPATESGGKDPGPAAESEVDDPAPTVDLDGDAAPAAQPDGEPTPVAPTPVAGSSPVPPALCPAPTAGSAQVPPAFCAAPVAESAAIPADFCSAPPAFVIGAGVLPAPLLAATLDRATVLEIRHPGEAPPEPHYRPSRALADFVRCRDLTCRWPGCDEPAYGCDIDHTVPWPLGPTHASNTKCYCRFHHLLKTFYCGVGGWHEQQLPDGTLILTAPTGHTYTTKPGSALLFPTLCRPTATLWPPGQEPTVRLRGDRGAMMPKRRRTRAENLARRIEAERRLNDEYVAERNKPPPF